MNRRAVKATGVFLISVTIAMIPTWASFEFFRWLTFTDMSALVLAGGVGVIFGMLTAALFV